MSKARQTFTTSVNIPSTEDKKMNVGSEQQWQWITGLRLDRYIFLSYYKG